MTLRIVTDSTADLPAEFAERYGITVVPVSVVFGEKELRDGVDITSELFFRRLQRESVLPTTSQPPAGVFRETYERLRDEGATEILSIHISEKLSGTLESARQGSAGVAGVRILTFDSKFASAALGLAAMRAAAAAETGLDMIKAAAAVEEQLERTHLFFLLDTLEYLRRGGRIGRASEFVGTLLRVKPILEVRDGEVVPFARARTRRKAIEELLQRIAELRPIEQAMAFHATTPEDLDFIAARLHGLTVAGPVATGLLGPAIGVHTGPGTVGVAVVSGPGPSPLSSGP